MLQSKNIQHRDIKGRNVMLDDKMDAKLADFGEAVDILEKTKDQAVDGSELLPNSDEDFDPNFERRGSFKGTVNYMSPEMYSSSSTSLTGDIFAFGSVLFKMATGSVPFKGQTPEEVKKNVIPCSFSWPQ
jgi:serine/threonine protein kinase